MGVGIKVDSCTKVTGCINKIDGCMATLPNMFPRLDAGISLHVEKRLLLYVATLSPMSGWDSCEINRLDQESLMTVSPRDG